MRRLAVPLTLALALVAFGGCGNKRDAYTTADTEGVYLAADGLTYQVQLSRELNPALVEDRTLLRGLPASETRLTPDEVLFGVWLRVENNGNATHVSSDNFEIIDTEDNHYAPLTVDPSLNSFIYQPQTMRSGDLYPDLDSVASSCCPRQGALLIFRLNRSVYNNRPLDFDIRTTRTPVRTEASVELDL